MAKGPKTLKKKRLPLYRQIADKLRGGMQRRKGVPGGYLPSENELSEMHGASRDTIRTALKQLERDGLIRSCPGKGWEVVNLPAPEAGATVAVRVLCFVGGRLRETLDGER